MRTWDSEECFAGLDEMNKYSEDAWVTFLAVRPPWSAPEPSRDQECSVISHVLSTRAVEQDQARGAKEIDAQFAVVPDVFAQFANVVA